MCAKLRGVRWAPAPVFLPGERHGQRSLTGYSPWGREAGTTERLPLCVSVCFPETLSVAYAALTPHFSAQ